MPEWPPSLEAVRAELKREPGDTADDGLLGRRLDAAVALVERVRGSSFNFAGDPDSPLPAPTSDIELGTLRLAIRWHHRRLSPDGLVNLGELGSARVPSYDPDIERLLGLGRYRGPRGAFA
ncbi:MAG: hypothetical protein AB7P08_19075 [Burkholderiales bacterium]